MTIRDEEEQDQLAAEYALGVLDGAERQAFARALARDPDLAARVEFWNRLLGPLAEAVAPVEPPAALWSRIEAAHDRPALAAPVPAGWWSSLAFWRPAGLLGALAAVLLALYVALVAPSAPTHVAVLNAEGNRQAVVVTLDLASAAIAVRPLAPFAAQGALELWLLPGAGAAPRSLGLISATAAVARSVAPERLRGLAAGAALAVSLEPAGGSPTGLPTGPVLCSGPLLAIAHR
jgi:anti-sigma-K factor RskA